MAAGPLFRDTDMAAVTSGENTLLLQGHLKLINDLPSKTVHQETKISRS